MKTPKERVLAFGAHPDDVEFMCAGTLALLAAKGYEIHVACMAGGEMGSPRLSVQAIRARRLQEAAAAAALLGGAFHYAGGYDLEVDYNAAYRRRTTRVLREVDPLIVLTHAPTDYLIDHEETSRLVRTAAYIASIPNYDCETPTQHTGRFPYLYYWDAMGLRDIFGRPLPIGMYVDIGGVMEVKTRMLAAHASQREWLAHHNKDEYMEMMKSLARAAGRKAGVRYAEGFIQHLGHGHPQDNLLAQILGKACIRQRR
jgi:LmbE family N-acetylglucosaminyl deacetylase